MIEISEVRKRVLQTVDHAKRAAAERRDRTTDASRHYEAFLQGVATPVFRMFANVLTVEGHPFTLLTPQGRVRLERGSSGDFIELELDGSRNPPVVLGRTRRSIGRDVTSSERALGEAAHPLTDHDLVEFLLQELEQFLA